MTISTEVAQIYKARYGTGPRRITTFVNGDTVTCVLEGINTAVHAALVESGKIDLAHALHNELQHGMEAEMASAVARVTGRTVTGHIPGSNALLGATTNTFLLNQTPS